MNLKKFLPFKNYSFLSPLSEEEIKKRLDNNIEPKRLSIARFLKRSNTKPYQGTLYDHRFKMSRIIYHKNSFLPVIKGAISKHNDYTKIDINMQPEDAVLIFVGMWLCVTGPISLIILAGLLIKFETILQEGINMFVFLPLLMFIVVLVMAPLGFNLEKKKSKAFLAELLEAKEV